MHTTSNPHETLNRLRKVAIIVAMVPVPATNLEAFALAAILESSSRESRDRFAHAAGTNPPSEKTWSMVVEAVRGRATAEVWARLTARQSEVA